MKLFCCFSSKTGEKQSEPGPSAVTLRGGSRISNTSYIGESDLTHEYLVRLLQLIREFRDRVEKQGKRLSVDELKADLSEESAKHPTISLSVIETLVYQLLKSGERKTSPRKRSVTELEKMNPGEFLEWADKFAQTLM